MSGKVYVDEDTCRRARQLMALTRVVTPWDAVEETHLLVIIPRDPSAPVRFQVGNEQGDIEDLIRERAEKARKYISEGRERTQVLEAALRALESDR